MVNVDLILSIEQTPDTMIAFANGREDAGPRRRPAVLVERLVTFRRRSDIRIISGIGDGHMASKARRPPDAQPGGLWLAAWRAGGDRLDPRRPGDRRRQRAQPPAGGGGAGRVRRHGRRGAAQFRLGGRDTAARSVRAAYADTLEPAAVVIARVLAYANRARGRASSRSNQSSRRTGHVPAPRAADGG